MTKTGTDSPAGPTTYSMGYGAHARVLQLRSAERDATFLLPYLRPGMRLLDCGCGPGTITIGLAERVAPGPTIGIDVGRTYLTTAMDTLPMASAPNLAFAQANAFALPFPDESFDGVFSHVMLMHLPDPVAVLQEMRRVLRVGGIVAVRDQDVDGTLMWPSDAGIQRGREGWIRDLERAGADPRIGRKLASLVRAAGFARVQASAGYVCYGAGDATRHYSAMWAARLTEPEYVSRRVQNGCDPAALRQEHEAWTTWGEDPDAFLAVAHCEALGWKDGV